MHCFSEQASQLLKGQPPGKEPTSIAFIDCDNFKTVNDTLGHQTGDKLLQVVGRILSDSIRERDCVSRYGGDEFVILFTDTREPEAVKSLTRIKNSLDQAMHRYQWPVTFSIGVATFIGETESIESAIHLADELMYLRKQKSKNGISSKVFNSVG